MADRVPAAGGPAAARTEPPGRRGFPSPAGRPMPDPADVTKGWWVGQNRLRFFRHAPRCGSLRSRQLYIYFLSTLMHAPSLVVAAASIFSCFSSGSSTISPRTVLSHPNAGIRIALASSRLRESHVGSLPGRDFQVRATGGTAPSTTLSLPRGRQGRVSGGCCVAVASPALAGLI